LTLFMSFVARPAGDTCSTHAQPLWKQKLYEPDGGTGHES